MGFCEKDNTGKVPVSSHPIKSAYYQYDLSLKKIFPYWAVPGLSDGMQDLSLWHVGSSSVVTAFRLSCPMLCGILAP